MIEANRVEQLTGSFGDIICTNFEVVLAFFMNSKKVALSTLKSFLIFFSLRYAFAYVEYYTFTIAQQLIFLAFLIIAYVSVVLVFSKR